MPEKSDDNSQGGGMRLSENEMRELRFVIACARGHVPQEVQCDPQKLQNWWDSLNMEQKAIIKEDCNAYISRLDQKHLKLLKQHIELKKEHTARKWLTGALPAVLALHSISYVSEWWHSVLIFFGGVIALRLFLIMWDYLKGRY